jgi:hypothetical protein
VDDLSDMKNYRLLPPAIRWPSLLAVSLGHSLLKSRAPISPTAFLSLLIERQAELSMIAK